MVKENKLKQAIKEGKVVKGLIQFIPHPDIVEVIGSIGWDFIQLEGEHAITIDAGKILMLAADAANITPIVKVAGLDPLLITHWLDAGAQGVIVPHIRTKEDAELAVKSCKYVPVGIRSSCPGTRGAGHWGDPDFAKRANEEVMVLLNIEDVEGMSNLESIASVKGVDVICVGPGDISAALGVPGQSDHPKVRDAFIKLIDTCKAKGVAAGVLTTDYEQAKFFVERGAQYITFSNDKRWLRKTFQMLKHDLDEKLASISVRSRTKAEK
ncbi:HpcH/HpaI aldolase/citrate lyase family protein [Chloroflexota bacterium]